MERERKSAWLLLLVDDSESILALLAKIAGMIPHLEVAKAYSAESAIEIARARAPDLVISDLCMPGKDGEWLLQQMRMEHISCPFIVLTGCRDAARIIQLYRQGASRYLIKPASVHDIYKAMTESLPPPVRFEFQARPGSHVYVAGDFNAWNSAQYELIENPEPGHYQVTIPLSCGRHEYKFIVNEEWQCDPHRPEKAVNDQGIENSVIEVASPVESLLEKGVTLP